MLIETKKRLSEINARFSDGSYTIKDIAAFQELNYQKSVLETFLVYSETAIRCNNAQDVKIHCARYRRFLRDLVVERVYPLTNPEKRDTGLATFTQVVAETDKAIKAYAETHTDAEYAKGLQNSVKCVSAIWLAYRNTYLNY